MELNFKLSLSFACEACSERDNSCVKLEPRNSDPEENLCELGSIQLSCPKCDARIQVDIGVDYKMD